jgi:hypothetical protein
MCVMNGFHAPYRDVSVKVDQTVAAGAGMTTLRSMMVMRSSFERG